MIPLELESRGRSTVCPRKIWREKVGTNEKAPCLNVHVKIHLEPVRGRKKLTVDDP